MNLKCLCNENAKQGSSLSHTHPKESPGRDFDLLAVISISLQCFCPCCVSSAACDKQFIGGENMCRVVCQDFCM